MKLHQAVIAIFLLLCVPAHASELKNQLTDHPAPYLALHGDDPVAWQAWNEESVQLARQQNKILYLSIGYFACHWCHVMQQESYKNEKIAEFLNENFIPVKIDRELEPALDRRLMDFTQRIIGRGGWPLNVFVTPTGHPIYSLLYAPPEQFLETLNRLQRVWQNDRQRVLDLVSNEAVETFQIYGPNLERSRYQNILAESARIVMLRADLDKGGFGDKQKFPSAPQLQYLLKQYQINPQPAAKAFLTLTLDAMADLGLVDHLIGGFFRYTTDTDWSIPHFEKMLYDNANLALLYLNAGKVLGSAKYESIGQQTLTYMQKYMWHQHGALISSFSAVDDNNVEGGSYLWQPAEIAEILDPEQANLIFSIWGLDQESELPRGNHVRLMMSLGQYANKNNLKLDEAQQRYEQARTKLIAARLKRSLPMDDKLLAGWNGLALSAFVSAAAQFPELSYNQTAKALRDFLVNQLWDGKALARSMTKGRLLGTASLEDYAYVARGLFDWASLSNSDGDFEVALAITKQGWQRFYRNNGWYQGDDTLLASVSGEPMLADTANPAPSAVLISTSLELAKKFSDDELKEKALSALNRNETLLIRAPFWYVSQLEALSLALEN
ncbi:thioredoxin domain-containing protein [Candidatus Spongiihabitans sp.]|uniref:thioredoxin domain-containing protein n=1 Tax=Candidatus Spongiihabitans sp. TaxID=3101308 RepID=UPI003C6F1C71